MLETRFLEKSSQKTEPRRPEMPDACRQREARGDGRAGPAGLGDRGGSEESRVVEKSLGLGNLRARLTMDLKGDRKGDLKES